ncbi:MAG: YlmC/YmxH family sporulation protein [Clostridiales bacterium]|jgi:YlmC/YmxH family sporulation protein|nr:YlmC/YmxH family sporulation protein [Clostridiales bacterium]
MDNCCLNDLFRKEVINIDTGNRYGFVCDVEVNVCTGRISAIILYGKNKFWGFGGREDDKRIPWEDIVVIGDETILVKMDRCTNIKPPKGRRGGMDNFFR